MLVITMRRGGRRGGQDHRGENEKDQKYALGHSRLFSVETLSHDFDVNKIFPGGLEVPLGSCRVYSTRLN